jgi:hypothetical protein
VEKAVACSKRDWGKTVNSPQDSRLSDQEWFPWKPGYSADCQRPSDGVHCRSCVRACARVCRSRDSAVDIATGYGLDDRGVRIPSPIKVTEFSFSTSSRPALGSTQPPIQWVPGALSPGVRRPDREADHSHPTSDKVKKTWIYTSTSQYAFVA